MFSGNFERAVNTVSARGLGDPELWGGSHTVEWTTVPGQTFTAQIPQLVRVQVPDLVATAWDVVAVVRVVASPAIAIMPSVVASITIGTGRASTVIPWDVTGHPSQLGDATTRVAQLVAPLPAAAMAIAATIQYDAPPEDPPTSIVATISAHVAPRGYGVAS
jgi:hypothetical protein